MNDQVGAILLQVATSRWFVLTSTLIIVLAGQFNHLVSRFIRKIAKPLHGDLSSAQRDDILQGK
jgi:hypothetical protein